jgi:hypothetical protein
LLEGVEFEQLVSDVAEHGLLNPIALYQGKRQEEEQQKAKAALATRDAKAAQEAKDRADALRRAGESCASL